MNFEKILIAFALLCLCASIGCEEAQQMMPPTVADEPTMTDEPVDAADEPGDVANVVEDPVTPNEPREPEPEPEPEPIVWTELGDGLVYRWDLTLWAPVLVLGADVEGTVGITHRDGLLLSPPWDLVDGEVWNLNALPLGDYPQEILVEITGDAETAPDIWINWKGNAYPINLPEEAPLLAPAEEPEGDAPDAPDAAADAPAN